MKISVRNDLSVKNHLILSLQQSGFTLLEVLIGMSIMSIMMLLLFAALNTCVQSWNAGEKKIAQVSQAAIVQRFLRQKLQSTLPLDENFLKDKPFSFQGSSTQLQFVAAMPASAGRLGLQLFTLKLEKNARDIEGKHLSVDIKPFFPQSETEQWREENVVILKKVSQLQFAYFGAVKNSNKDFAWHTTWLERNELPKLVSVNVQLSNGEIWPQLIVALRVDAVGYGNEARIGRNPFGIINGKFTTP